MRKIILSVFVAAALATVGCGGSVDDSCHAVCEQSNACEGAAQQDCDHACSLYTESDAISSCSDETIDVFDCVQDQDVCDPNFDGDKACGTELQTWIDCVSKYCEANPDNASCQGGLE